MDFAQRTIEVARRNVAEGGCHRSLYTHYVIVT